MGRLGPVLVVWEGQAGQDPPLQGAHRPEEGDHDIAERGKEAAKEQERRIQGDQVQASRRRSRKGVGYHVWLATARCSNTTIRDLLSNERYAGGVLEYLKATRVGEVKVGVLSRGLSVSRLPSFSFFPFRFPTFSPFVYGRPRDALGPAGR